MPSPRRSIITLSFAIFFAAPAARAALPSAAYVLPRSVEFRPDRATATQVVLRGAFINTAGGYPHGSGCGQMHFICPAGGEALCQQQWDGIAAAIGTSICQGFGASAIAIPLTLLRDDAPLASPATWDVAAGVRADDYVEKYCPTVRSNACSDDLSGWDGPVGGETDTPLLSQAGCSVGGGQAGADLAVLCVAAAPLLRRRRPSRRGVMRHPIADA